MLTAVMAIKTTFADDADFARLASAVCMASANRGRDLLEILERILPVPRQVVETLECDQREDHPPVDKWRYLWPDQKS